MFNTKNKIDWGFVRNSLAGLHGVRKYESLGQFIDDWIDRKKKSKTDRQLISLITKSDTDTIKFRELAYEIYRKKKNN